MQPGRPEGIEPGQRLELPGPVGRQRRHDFHLGADRQDHRLVLGTQLPEERRAADFASGRRVPDMLKLRSSATATDSGKSPAAKLAIA